MQARICPHASSCLALQLPSLTTLELQYVAPALVRAQVGAHPVLQAGVCDAGRDFPSPCSNGRRPRQCAVQWTVRLTEVLWALCVALTVVVCHKHPSAGHLPPHDAPTLLAPPSWQGLELAVPGTYIAGEPLVTIAAFAPQLHVITSKQRPRKLTIHGSDGAEYMFLLKVCWGWQAGVRPTEGWLTALRRQRLKLARSTNPPHTHTWPGPTPPSRRRATRICGRTSA